MPKQRFIAVATGQNVSNLPPILEFANPGDEVVWIESAEARDKRWVDGAKGVLNGLGIDQTQILISNIQDPGTIASEVQRSIPPVEGCDTIYVLNGGLKLVPIGVLAGCMRNSIEVFCIYGESKPSQYRYFDVTLLKQSKTEPYTRHHFDLPNILACKQHKIIKGTLLWNSESSYQFPNIKFGLDNSKTLMYYENRQRYSSDINLNVGTEFELAVGFRVCRLIRESVFSSIQSVWWDVIIENMSKPGLQVAQWDITIVLKSGNVIILECKSFESELKDMHAQKAEAQRLTSYESVFRVVMPCFSDYLETKWFYEQFERFYNHFRTGRLDLIAYDLPDQKCHSFIIPTRKDQTEFQFDPFEESLRKLIEPYEPKP